jgi:death on curing protein
LVMLCERAPERRRMIRCLASQQNSSYRVPPVDSFGVDAPMAEIVTVSIEDVLRIHEILAADFARSNDPISPAGVRDLGLLESAIGWQFTGTQSTLKYATPTTNAATLLYGLCNDHPFHNGNKRTALVAMLVHLDKNGQTLKDTNQKELFDMILGVAAHTIVLPKRLGRGAQGQGRASADEEVAAVAEWIRRRAAKPDRGERQITYRELRRVLGSHGFELAQSAWKGNSLDIYREEEEKRFLRSPRRVRKRALRGSEWVKRGS